MAKYIEREALLKNLKENHDDFMTDPTIDKRIKWRESLCYHRVLKAVYKTPLVDVVEVKHGEWISNAQTDEFVCSECDGIAPVDCEKEDFYESNFCPNCGAKMDGKGDTPDVENS